MNLSQKKGVWGQLDLEIYCVYLVIYFKEF